MATRSKGPGGRLIKWSDFIRPPYEALEDTTPVFMFAEARGSTHDPLTFVCTPTRPSDAELVALIRQHINDPTLGKVEARDYIAMQWKDRRHFWKAMEAFLLRGIAVSPQCRLTGRWFRPADLSVPWDPVTAEGPLIRGIRASVAEHQSYNTAVGSYAYLFDALPYTHKNSWHTPEGAALVAWWRGLLRKQRLDAASSSDEEFGPEHVDRVEDVPPRPLALEVPLAPISTLAVEPALARDVILPLAPPAEEEDSMDVDEEGQDEKSRCVICLERRADTMVLPCEHVVCCRECSQRLRETPNARVCVYCRQPIKAVLADTDT